jgi:glycosyltransferase involved in cell wall biosynthesis
MTNSGKQEITVLIPCLNEDITVGSAVEAFKSAGFIHVLVIDDGSMDSTSVVAEGAGAKVIHNNKSIGFNLAVLKGLYAIKTPAALIISDPESGFDFKMIQEFIEFGAMGKYSLLLSKGSSSLHMIDFSKLLKKRFGIFLDNPGFQGVLLNPTMLKVVKDKVTGGSPYIYFELVKEAVKSDAKIGVFPSGIYEFEPEHSSAMKLHKYTRDAHRMQEQRGYIKYAFPDLNFKKFQRDLVLGISVALISSFLTIFLPKLFD